MWGTSMRTSKEYSTIHNYVVNQYTVESLDALFLAVFPTPQKFFSFAQKVMKHVDTSPHDTLRDQWDIGGYDMKLEFARFLQEMKVESSMVATVKGVFMKSKSVNNSGVCMPSSKIEYDTVVREYISAIDAECFDVRDTVSKVPYSELCSQVMELKSKDEHSTYTEKLRWVLLTNQNCCMNILGMSLAGITHVRAGIEEYVKDTAEFVKLREIEIKRSERVITKEQSSKRSLEETIESLRRQNQLLSEEMRGVKDAYDAQSKSVKDLNVQVERVKSTDIETVKIELELMTGDWRDVTDEIEITREYVQELETGAQQRRQDIDRLRHTIDILLKARDDTAEELTVEDADTTRRSTYEERFSEAGLDYTIVHALVWKGFKRARMIGNSYLQKVFVLGNTFTHLNGKVSMTNIEEQAIILVKSGAILEAKQGEVWSLNNDTTKNVDKKTGIDVSGINIPVVREYLTEMLRDSAKLKTGVPVIYGGEVDLSDLQPLKRKEK